MDWDKLQTDAVDELFARIKAGAKRICVTAPTGFGKTRIMTMASRRAVSQGMKLSVYTHRRMLFEQTATVYERAGLNFGKRAHGHETELWRRVQLAMIPTEANRAIKYENRDLHAANLVFYDEGHAVKSGAALDIWNQHQEHGAACVMFTATPIGVGHMCDDLVVVANNYQCRQVGAHVPCLTYGPNEVDLQHIKRQSSGEYQVRSLSSVYATQHIFGSVFDWWKKLNPAEKPAVLFGPDVRGALYFAEMFRKRGIPTAHIDAKTCMINGEEYKTTQAVRDDIAAMSESGEVKLVTNRFVLREGIDWPWLYHAIMATTFGTEEGFLQAGGRLLRNHESLEHVVLQCHGGSWHRYGSLNENREWSLEDTNKSREKVKKKKREEGDPDVMEPQRCPQCTAIRKAGLYEACPICGHKYKRSVRQVVEVDGDLQYLGEKRVVGMVTKKKTPKPPRSAWQKVWDGMYYGSLNSKSNRPMNFRQLRTRFERDTKMRVGVHEEQMVVYVDGQPQRLLNVPPPTSSDWHAAVRDVDVKELQT